MKIFLNIEAGSAEELRATIADLGALAGPQVVGAIEPIKVQAAEVETKPAEQAADEPKKPRGRAAKAEAKPAEKPTDPANQNTGAAPGGEAASSSTAAATEPPAITQEEVRNQIIDLLNDWSEAKPDDKEIRTTILRPLLADLGAEKLSGIDPSKYALVPALVDASRAELDAYKGGSAED